tara:strand:- start:376 stop:642 length:267 start_codon:yes stop_codon:yes gene_type:complete
MTFYKNQLEIINSGLFLQLEGSVGRYYVRNFLDTGIFKPSGKEGRTVTDGYGREITLHDFIIDEERIDELWDTDEEFMRELEEYDEIT